MLDHDQGIGGHRVPRAEHDGAAPSSTAGWSLRPSSASNLSQQRTYKIKSKICIILSWKPWQTSCMCGFMVYRALQREHVHAAREARQPPRQKTVAPSTRASARPVPESCAPQDPPEPRARTYRHRFRAAVSDSGPKCDISHFRRGAGWLRNGSSASRRWRRPGPFPAGAPPRHPRPRGPWDTSGQAPGPRTPALN